MGSGNGQGVVGAVPLGSLRANDDGQHDGGQNEMHQPPATAGEEEEADAEEDREPDDRERAGERDDGEGCHADERPQDVPAVAWQGSAAASELVEPLRHELPDRREAEGAQDEAQRDRQHDAVHNGCIGGQVVVEEEQMFRCRLRGEDHAAHGAAHRYDREEAERPGQEQRAPSGPKAAEPQSQERAQEDEVGEVGEHPHLARQPADQCELLEQRDEGSRGQLEAEASECLPLEIQAGIVSCVRGEVKRRSATTTAPFRPT